MDYSQTIIYKICCKDPNITDIYIGHTTNFIQRKHNHKTNCCNNVSKNHNLNVYKFIRNNGGWENWSMIQIEIFSCNNSQEALIRERFWIETLKSTLNSNKPYTSIEEKESQKQKWYEDNKDTILQKLKEHYEENKHHKLEYQKQYAEYHKEQISDYQKKYKETNKEKLAEQKKIYREEHKEQTKENNKAWREANKEKIKSQKSEIINCECGYQYTFGNKHRHLQTKNHIQYNEHLCQPIIYHEAQKLLEENNEEDKALKIKEQQKIYRETNFEQIQNYKKQHYEQNKEQILEQNKKYRELHKEQILEKQKQYIENNKDMIKQNKAEWYQKNKDNILEKQKELIICECCSQIRKAGRAEHLKSKKHIVFIESNTI